MTKQEEKIIAHIESEWEKFLAIYMELSPEPNNATIAILKAGFYTGFKAGVCAMHDADEILQ